MIDGDIIFVNQYNKSIEGKTVTPVGLVSLCQVLDKEGLKGILCDFNTLISRNEIIIKGEYYSDQRAMAKYLAGFNTRIVSIYTMANNLHTALTLCSEIKIMRPDIITILAGPQATAVGESILSEFNCVDIIGMGEGELTICNIVRHLKNIGLNNLRSVKGLMFREGDSIISTYDENMLINIEDLPFIDYEKIPTGRNNKDVIEIEVGRGCPFSCVYCSTSLFWGRKYRMKSSERIVEEIKYYNSLYDTKYFLFQHDLFVLDRTRVMEVCNRIIAEKIVIKWVCYARLDTLDEEVIAAMAASGCKQVFIGIESGSERIQRIIGKNLRMETLNNVLDLLECYNISFVLSFIINFPFENENDINKTLDTMYCINNRYHLKRDMPGTFVSDLCFFPNTPITSQYLDELVFDPTKFSAEVGENTDIPEGIIEMIKDNRVLFSQFYSVGDNSNRRDIVTIANILFSSFYHRYYNIVDPVLRIYKGRFLELIDTIISIASNDNKREVIDEGLVYKALIEIGR